MCLSIVVEHPELLLAEGEHLGFKWTVVHNRMGYRCGYVRVPVGHPWHGVDHDSIGADCHGGLTFSQADVPCSAPGPDNAWWVGFDCAHGFDAPDPALMASVSPEMRSSLFVRGSLYADRCTVRDQSYVEAQCFLLCAQAASLQ